MDPNVSRYHDPIQAGEGQLRNHIPLAGPATREPCDGSESPLRVSLGFTPRWYHQRLGVDFGKRWHTDPHYRYDTLVAMKEYLHSCFPDVPYFVPRYDTEGREPSCATISGVYGILLIPMLYGAVPSYSEDGWPDAHPVLSADDIRAYADARPAVIDLESSPVFLQLKGQMERIHAAWGAVHGYLNYQGVINVAVKLRGSELFLDMLDQPEAVKAFFEHIGRTIGRVSKAVQGYQRSTGFPVDLLSMSNCTVSMISPAQYEEFLLQIDRRLSTEYERFGIHTCNWVADPYLDAMGRIEHMGYFDTGTRSDLRRIRKLFPDTRRAVLLFPEEVESQPLAELERLVRRIHREYAPCDLVLADVESTMPDERIRDFLALVRREEARAV